MIILERNSINKVVVTLTEVAKLPLPFFLFVFESDGDTEDDPVKWTGTNLADAQQIERFDIYEIEESDTGDESGAINGPIKMSKGQYTYKIYESATATLDVSQTTGRIVEEGMARVIEEGDEAETYNDVYAGK